MKKTSKNNPREKKKEKEKYFENLSDQTKQSSSKNCPAGVSLIKRNCMRSEGNKEDIFFKCLSLTDDNDSLWSNS